MAFKKASKEKNSLLISFLFFIVSPLRNQEPVIKEKGVILLHTSLETTDIFRGAFFICMGGQLKDIRFNRQIASFMFTGSNLHQYDRDYINGHALVNPLQFREALNRLRDILFKQLRDKRTTRYDKRNNYRNHQNGCRS